MLNELDAIELINDVSGRILESASELVYLNKTLAVKILFLSYVECVNRYCNPKEIDKVKVLEELRDFTDKAFDQIIIAQKKYN